MAEGRLFSWIHISDIHAGHGDAAVQDDQQIVMAELLRDVEREVPKLGGVDAIMVTGDVAFRGAPSDYALATTFLEGLRSVAGLDAQSVFVVPGNHDVDRGVAKAHGDFALALGDVRRGARDLPALVHDFQGPLEARTAAYRDFVKQVAPRCTPTLGGTAGWVHERLLFEDTWLRLVGLDTALLSQDDADRGQLRVGRSQLRPVIGDPARDALRVTLAHHPVDWLGDPGEDRRRLESWSDVFLHGHVHLQGGRQTFEGGGDRALRVIAGAAHCDPGEPPSHSYQLASLVRLPSGRLCVRIWPRVAYPGRGFGIQGDYAQGLEGYAQFDLRQVSPRKTRAALGAPSRRVRSPRAPAVVGEVPLFVPPLSVFVAWHPKSAEGARVAHALFDALRGGGENEGIGIPTFFRSAPRAGAAVPLDVPLNGAGHTAVVMLMDESVCDDDDWLDWLVSQEDACRANPTARLYPVWLDAAAATAHDLEGQAIRTEGVEPAERESFVVHRVLHALWRHLSDDGAVAQGGSAPRPVRVFLSHAKADGEGIARDISAFLGDEKRQLQTWFDRRDIADGSPFAQEISAAIEDKHSVLLAIQTDAFWERPWCVDEFLTALESQRPIVVVDASSFSGQRHCAWLGKAPVVRWQGPNADTFFQPLLRALVVEALRFAFLPRYLEAVARTFGVVGDLSTRPTQPTSFDILNEAKAKRILYPDPVLPPRERAVLERLALARGITLHTPATLLVTP